MKPWLLNRYTMTLLILVGSAFVIWGYGKEPQRKTCDRIDTRPCQCDKTGVCLCEPGGRSCDSCKHLVRPEIEAELQAVKLKEFAERVQNRPAVQK